jgi:hypothetical protein
MEKIMVKIAQKLQEKLSNELGLATIINAMKDKNVQD